MLAKIKKSPKIILLVGLIIIFFGVKALSSALEPNPTWCDCDKVAGDAIDYTLWRGQNGSTAKYDEKLVRACAKKVLRVNKDLKLEPEEIGVEYISQFSYEICKNGYYEGKGSDNRGKKYYPGTEK